jgi:outer membrane lipoprotein-sorting protein
MLLVAALLMTLAPGDLLLSSARGFEGIESYRVTMRSRDGDGEQVIRYEYRRPGFVRMEFVRPHGGAVLVYDPVTKKARLQPFGFLKSFVLTLDPDNVLIRSPRGHSVDESDIGALLRAVRRLAERGTVEGRGEEEIGGRRTAVVEVAGDGDYSVGGIHRYVLWLDEATGLPVKVRAFDAGGALLEEVFMEDIEIAR